MNILLITPSSEKQIYSGVPEVFCDLRGVHPPMGLLYIASYLRENVGDEDRIDLYDISGEGDTLEVATEKIKKINPDIVAIQMLTLTAPNVLKTLCAVKKINKNIITVVGGPHPTIYPVETVGFDDIDYVIMGEGEKPFCNLIKSIREGDLYPRIKAVAFKEKGEVYANRNLDNLDNIDLAGYVDRGLLNLRNYKSYFTKTVGISSSIVTSRGCPYSCIFCAKFENKFRAHSPSYVVSDIKNCIKLGIREIFVVDDTFSLDMARAKEICQIIIKEKLKFNWYINTRVDMVDKELLKLLKRAGCRQINYGIESGSQKVVDILNKNISLFKAKEIIKETKESGIDTLCYFMLGLPGETLEEIEETKKFIIDSEPDFVRFSVTTIEPGTMIHQMAVERGLLSKDTWVDFAKNPVEDFAVPIWNENLSEESLNKLLLTITKEYHLRSLYLIKKLFKIRNTRDLFVGLSSFLKIMKERD